MRVPVWLAVVAVLGGEARGDVVAQLDAANLAREFRRQDRYAQVMTRAEWERTYRAATPSVETRTLPGKVRTGYIKLHNFFAASVCQEFGEYLTQIKTQKIRRLVLDLRNNPGGPLEVASCVAGLLLGPQTMGSAIDLRTQIPRLNQWIEPPTEPKGEQTLLATGEKIYDGAVTVLINLDTATTAELVAAALRDHRRAWLVGGRTAGKGVVQEYAAFKNHPELMLIYSTAKFSTPMGQVLEGMGLEPMFATGKLRDCLALKPWVWEQDFHQALALAVLDCAANEPIPAFKMR